ncbi:DUF2061 domain-containing protein [Marinobacter zhejiangensis]|uniref:Uncharacterized membrane protein n=1 Tax=Marinobacter zhejiangensis TaxID=488535 RepID=A0A1I4KZP9_9GAMM|nr:DUF2061 domain-containing protein [Marinobacter zhejiangensis]SFL84282.1 Uncharacterized membrane protein [Marinobacter zhejiangensis]
MSALKAFVHHHGTAGDQSLLKTATFAMTHFSVAFTVAYLLTGDVWVGGLIAMVEPAINTVAYFIHEKVWQGRLHRASSLAKPDQYHAGPVKALP